MIKKVHSHILNISLLFFLANSAQALPSCPKEISVGFYEFGLLYHEGQGIDRQIIDELAKRTLCKFKSQALPRPQIWQLLDNGSLMMSVSAVKTTEREQFSLFSEPYLRLKNMAVLPRSIAELAPSPQAFLAQSNLRWGVVQSYRHGAQQDEFIAQLRSQHRVDEASDSQQLFEWIHQGKVQGIFAQSTAYNYYYRHLNFTPLPVARDWAKEDKGVDARLVFSKKHFTEADIEQWNLVLRAMRKDGTLAKILRQHLPEFEIPRLMDQTQTADRATQQKPAK
ncbi:transporter substrate-binding domain-containing protein [Chitinibacter bivalviorum]|uniref:Transporter substrate-binding domain-containing protein n=1 Tax=Chitinibacter bivalviorum TaxID=2739434 RepID=A0A7H9BKH8_9NEIS|nr:transporter substrate-binding domain-containing protein [Chitinibacter bivalviorum]QLG88521.1 transporter substrate-binding domain-containing protein [Chitinibacter bivalviorum]